MLLSQNFFQLINIEFLSKTEKVIKKIFVTNYEHQFTAFLLTMWIIELKEAQNSILVE